MSKRKQRDDNNDVFSCPPPGSSNGVHSNMDLSLLEALEKSQSAVEVLDQRTLKKLVLSFERCLKDPTTSYMCKKKQKKKWVSNANVIHKSALE
jgi:beta-catenin-like protein 1